MSKVRLINQVEQNSVNMIDIKLKEGQTGYNIIEEYIRRYWRNNIIDDVIISLGISYDGNTYEMIKEVASKNFKDIEFLND